MRGFSDDSRVDFGSCVHAKLFHDYEVLKICLFARSNGVLNIKTLAKPQTSVVLMSQSDCSRLVTIVKKITLPIIHYTDGADTAVVRV